MIRRAAVVTALALALSAGTACAEDAAAPVDPHVAKARGAIKGLGEALKEKLGAAMKEGGPAKAIDVCNTAAMPITDDQGKAAGVKIGRTALKVRNEKNAPDAFEKRVLEKFIEQLKAGADVAKLDYAETVTENGVKTFRYMKPIPMLEKPCATCHGATIAPELKAEIDKRYPKDAATGFAPGELRGAFTVSETLK
jgi:hypothetical protein